MKEEDNKTIMKKNTNKINIIKKLKKLKKLKKPTIKLL